MKVFITGATGYIGSAVAALLRERGHEVTALVRADSDSHRLRDLGVALVDGDIDALPGLSTVISAHDSIVHTASSPQDKEGADARALDALLAHASENTYVLYTSGVWVLGDTSDADETSSVDPLPIVAWRPAHEQRVLEAGGQRVSSGVIRPGCVYGRSQSLLRDWFQAADAGDPVRVIGNGRNRWALVHIADLADLYARMIEQRHAGIAHGIDDSNEPLGESATALIRSSGKHSRIEFVDPESVRPRFGPFVDALILDQRISSRDTRKQTGWNPTRTFTTSLEEQWAEWRRATR